MAEDVRWLQRYENLGNAYRQMQEAVEVYRQDEGNKLIRMALIKSFEISFELAWKTVKDYLRYNGIDAKLPREVIKQAFANDVIEDGQLWIDMLDARNLMAHVYDESAALDAARRIAGPYGQGVEQVYRYLSAKRPGCSA
jgi:nucleotidyltransferase substrate binding protein (TIGR01987 family)